MAKRAISFTVATVSLISTFILAQPAAAQAMKVGFVNMDVALQGSPQYEQIVADIEREFAPRLRQINSDSEELRKLEERLQTDSAIMSATEKTRLEREIYDQQRSLNRDAQEYQEDLSIRRNEEQQRVFVQIVDAIRVVGDAEDFDLILPEGAVLFAAENLDITEQVVEQLRRNASN